MISLGQIRQFLIDSAMTDRLISNAPEPHLKRLRLAPYVGMRDHGPAPEEQFAFLLVIGQPLTRNNLLAAFDASSSLERMSKQT